MIVVKCPFLSPARPLSPPPPPPPLLLLLLSPSPPTTPTPQQEITSIITARLAYILLRHHRFVFNLGYGFDGSDPAMTTVGMLFTTMCLEISFEAFIDAMAMYIEGQHGVDLNEFWNAWRKNPISFWGCSVSTTLFAVWYNLFAFSVIPTPFFCTSPTDVCSCTGGGFEMYAKFCDANAKNDTSNLTATVNKAAEEYQDPISSLGPNLIVIIASIGAILMAILIVLLADSLLKLNKERALKYLAEKKKAEVLEKTAKIQEEMMLNSLDDEQVKIVRAHASDIEGQVHPRFKLDWRLLKFLKRIGSGSFGDCFMGFMGKRPVAIKKMRVGLIDEEAFTSFAQEVVMLSKLENEFIIEFLGYSLDPVLLIVMEFAGEGTLKELILGAQEQHAPIPFSQAMIILVGTGTGMEYLHAHDPSPIIHRDIKSENILLTEKLEPRIADLGEARTMAINRTMTTVGSNGYTAPEVLRGEHYGTPADVFSFAIVMSELVSLRSPYADMLRNDQGKPVATWEQLTEMTKTSGLRVRVLSEDGVVLRHTYIRIHTHPPLLLL